MTNKNWQKGVFIGEFLKRILNKFVAIPLILLSLAGIVLLKCTGPLGQSLIDLKKGFIIPPKSTRPILWWHWMNDNISW
jgi:hypothetical protein